jgi:hypothetical protein
MPGKREEQLAMANKWITELPNHKGAWTVTPAEVTELKEFADEAQLALNRLVSGSAVDVARARDGGYGAGGSEWGYFSYKKGLNKNSYSNTMFIR